MFGLDLFEIALIGVAAFAAGAVNSVAGGGTFFSFPALLAVGVPPLDEQTSEKWLGGGDKSSVARILKDTAEFLKDQKKITAVKDSYGEFADPQYAEAAKALSN